MARYLFASAIFVISAASIGYAMGVGISGNGWQGACLWGGIAGVIRALFFPLKGK